MNLNEFIDKERKRFETRHNNIFTVTFSSINTYHEFLFIVIERYQNIVKIYGENNKEITKSFKKYTSNGEIINEKDMLLLEERTEIGKRLNLEIESFYLFSKILLDKISRAIEFYFGSARNLSLDSHDDLTKRIKAFSEAKDLVLPDNLFETISNLKKDISDFRDYAIAHEKRPRTIKYYMLDENGMKMILNSIYPKDSDQQQESKSLEILIQDINNYISNMITFIESNSNKTNLDLVHKETK